MENDVNEELDEKVNDDDDFEEELIGNPLKRVVMILFSPRLVYESLLVKSSRLDWIIPVTLSILFALFLMNAGSEYLRSDQLDAAINPVENNNRLTEEEKAAQIEQIEQNMDRSAGITRIIVNVGAVIGTFVWLSVIALAMVAVSRFVLDGQLAFGDAFKIGALGSMATLVGSVVKMPLIFYLESFSEAKTSLGQLFPEGMAELFLVKLLDIDIFVLWFTIIISIGLSVFLKKSLTKVLVPMALLWFVYRIAAILIAGAFSSLGS